MRISVVIAVALVAIVGHVVAQEPKPVPKDSVRVSIPGCTKGYIFTAGRPTTDVPGSVSVPVGMHIRMNAPKKMIAEIKAQEGSMIEITGLMKKGQYKPGGVSLGGGVRVAPAPSGRSPVADQISIDVEGWRPVPGNCASR